MKLEIKARGGIIGTISDAIYSSTLDKLREIVANSVDAGASCVVISFNRDEGRLSIIDNGTGIHNDEIQRIFESLGYGLKKHQEATLSHFGLGLISILQLAKSKAYIYSLTKDGKKVLCCVDTSGFFDPKNEDQELKELGRYVDVEQTPEEEAIARCGSIIDRLLQDHDDLKTNYGFNTYTEIILQGVEEPILDDLVDVTFIERLRRVLPLPLRRSDEFFSKFKNKELKDKFIAFFDDEKLCRIINAFLNDEGYIPDSTQEDQEQTGFTKLFKYFPPFGRLREITEENLLINDSREQDFKFYLLARVDDLFTKDEGEQGKKINGFTVRNQNFMVKENDYFDYDFLRPRLIQGPLRGWLYGEIFHKDLSGMLEVSRREFLESKKDFQAFAQAFVKEVDDLSKKLREAYNQRKTLRNDFLEPLREVTRGYTFKNIETKIRVFCDDDKRGQAIQKLSMREPKDWFDNDTYLLENALKEEDFELLYNGVKIVISKDIDDFEDEMILQVSRDAEDNVYKLPASLFQSREAEPAGRTI